MLPPAPGPEHRLRRRRAADTSAARREDGRPSTMAAYSDADLDAAVAAGVLAPEAAAAFREHAARKHRAPAADEEHFRLVTGFNDVFVVIAGLLALSASVGIVRAGTDSPMAPGLVTMGLSWLLAEYFTLRRRMALPSIVFLLAFVSGAFWTGLSSSGFGESPGLHGTFEFHRDGEHGSFALRGAGGYALVAAFGLAALAAWGHWRRFRVPVTVAAAVAAIVGVAIAGLAKVAPDFVHEWFTALVLGSGLGVFALAMYWDRSDPERRTRRADVAFWLHLVASVLIVHPVFLSLGGDGAPGQGAWKAWSVVGLYALMGVVALIVDRRALLVSGLLYLVLAVGGLIGEVVAVGMEFEVSSFFIGAILLLLSVFWRQARAALLAKLPAAWQAGVPAACGRR